MLLPFRREVQVTSLAGTWQIEAVIALKTNTASPGNASPPLAKSQNRVSEKERG